MLNLTTIGVLYFEENDNCWVLGFITPLTGAAVPGGCALKPEGEGGLRPLSCALK